MAGTEFLAAIPGQHYGVSNAEAYIGIGIIIFLMLLVIWAVTR